MNEDISSHNDAIADEPIITSGAELDGEVRKDKLACVATLPPGCDPDELNPKNYAFLPSCWTQKIRAAGRPTHKAQSLAGIFCWTNDTMTLKMLMLIKPKEIFIDSKLLNNFITVKINKAN